MDAERPAVLHAITDEFVETLKKEFPEDWWTGPTVRLRFWMRWFFALISKDWNRIHFRAIVPVQKRPSVVAHGAMLFCLLPRLTGSLFEKLQRIAAPRAIIDASVTCKFVTFCTAHSYVYVRVRRKGLRKEENGIMLTLEYEIRTAEPDLWPDTLIQKGSRMLLITDPM